MLNAFLDKFIYTSTLKYVHNNFYLAEVPFTIVPTDLLVGVCADQNPDFDRLLYYDVKNSTLKRLIKQFDVQFGMQGDGSLKLLEDFFVASGWGSIEVENIDPKEKRAIIKVTNSPISTSLKGKVEFPVDHMLRGVFAGMFSNYFKTPVECVETKCFAMNDPQCEFVIKKLEDFDFGNKLTRRQLKLES